MIPAKRPDLSFIEAASSMVGSVLSDGDIVIYESTVYPGATEEICIPILEIESNLKFNHNFFCGYSPERINPGDKVNTLTKITKVVSGSNKEVMMEISELYGSIISAGIFQAPSIKVAEAAKVIENSQRDLNIAFVNELSVIFNRMDIDTMDVLEAAGSKWNFLPFKPGMVGGHCIGVDPYYLTHKAEEIGYNPQVVLAGRRINDNMARYAAKSLIMKMLQNNIDVTKAKIGILGITFKENCPDTRNSKIIDLIAELNLWNTSVIVHDPWADIEKVKQDYGIELIQIKDFCDLDCVVVAVGHDDFRAITIKELRQFCKPKSAVLGDLKSLYDKKLAISFNFDVFRL